MLAHLLWNHRFELYHECVFLDLLSRKGNTMEIKQVFYITNTLRWYECNKKHEFMEFRLIQRLHWSILLWWVEGEAQRGGWSMCRWKRQKNKSRSDQASAEERDRRNHNTNISWYSTLFLWIGAEIFLFSKHHKNRGRIIILSIMNN